MEPMELTHAALLGVVQGATEYLPVSSSGHLVLTPFILGKQSSPFVFDVLVQMGTLLGVIVYFWRDLKDIALAVITGLWSKVNGGESFAPTPEAKLGWNVVLASIPAGVVGLLFKDWFEEAFKDPRITLGFLFVTAVLLATAERLGKQTRDEKSVTSLDAVLIGMAQAFALFPGVSRSGSTIALGMFRGLTREAAARFSFVMSVPIMVGAGLLMTKKLIEDPAQLQTHGPAVAVGFVVSAITGYICIRWFLGFLKHQSLYWFAGYCALVSVLGLAYFALKG